ncbi:MAG: hypothetical protein NUV46_02415 [Nanoarchaeota archaeon]|nr:hypothetical protein [Nanoarchaeota archaeon]
MVKEEEYLLTNQEILGGIKSALARGENLKQAMMSFYRAGYKKEEIEDAARAYLYLQRGASEESVLSEKEKSLKENSKKDIERELQLKKEEEEKKKSDMEKMKKETSLYGKGETKVPLISGEKFKEEKRVVQKISGYENQKMSSSGKGKTMTIVLIVTLIVLLGILGLVFLFKAELISFINNLFG